MTSPSATKTLQTLLNLRPALTQFLTSNQALQFSEMLKRVSRAATNESLAQGDQK